MYMKPVFSSKTGAVVFKILSWKLTFPGIIDDAIFEDTKDYRA